MRRARPEDDCCCAHPFSEHQAPGTECTHDGCTCPRFVDEMSTDDDDETPDMPSVGLSDEEIAEIVDEDKKL